jgi:hypothetical protein
MCVVVQLGCWASRTFFSRLKKRTDLPTMQAAGFQGIFIFFIDRRFFTLKNIYMEKYGKKCCRFKTRNP